MESFIICKIYIFFVFMFIFFPLGSLIQLCIFEIVSEYDQEILQSHTETLEGHRWGLLAETG